MSVDQHIPESTSFLAIVKRWNRAAHRHPLPFSTRPHGLSAVAWWRRSTGVGCGVRSEFWLLIPSKEEMNETKNFIQDHRLHWRRECPGAATLDSPSPPCQTLVAPTPPLQGTASQPNDTCFLSSHR